MEEQYTQVLDENSIPEWLYKAQRRLRMMEPAQRLEEELLCLSSWLSLNRFEERARTILRDDFSTVLSAVDGVGQWIGVGSATTGLMLPNSNVDFIVSPLQAGDELSCENRIYASLSASNAFYNVQVVGNSSARYIEAMHSKTGVGLVVRVEATCDGSFSSFLQESQKDVLFRPLYAVIHYYLLQNRVVLDDLHFLIPLSVLYCLLVLRKPNESSTLGSAFLLYLRFFSQEGNLLPASARGNNYPFSAFCSSVATATHISMDLESPSAIRRLRELASLFRHAHNQIFSALQRDSQSCILSTIFSPSPRLSSRLAESSYFNLSPPPLPSPSSSSSYKFNP
ncbi:hypothetical protein WA577_002580, partial [Blastocystis sp. JDR]